MADFDLIRNILMSLLCSLVYNFVFVFLYINCCLSSKVIVCRSSEVCDLVQAGAIKWQVSVHHSGKKVFFKMTAGDHIGFSNAPILITIQFSYQPTISSHPMLCQK
jgi:hypothetical protein